jgi:hypothetical protein
VRGRGLGRHHHRRLKACTKAGTACGGCVPLVTQVMKAEMKKQGLAVNNHVRALRVLAPGAAPPGARARSRASTTCWPSTARAWLRCLQAVAASILASCWNDFVLKKEHASLQDTNDYFLGNIQKDGTYSVVPRMPGGEVTPDGLIAVGQVAKKYGLYTKITGGQRVDLFGARVDQLPDIWEELIAAGFEPATPTASRCARSNPASARPGAATAWATAWASPSPGEPLQGPARAAQDQVRRLRLHPRMRRGAGQGRRHHRHRQGLEPLRLRQRRHEAAPCRTDRLRPG